LVKGVVSVDGLDAINQCWALENHKLGSGIYIFAANGVLFLIVEEDLSPALVAI
jgi:hypothetical protein